MTGTKHNSNRELIGQGVANIVTPLFGGIPATGAIARTATNVRSGAATPVSGIIQGLVVLSVLLVFAPFASTIPLASMAPILMVVAWNMSEMKKLSMNKSTSAPCSSRKNSAIVKPVKATRIRVTNIPVVSIL